MSFRLNSAFEYQSCKTSPLPLLRLLSSWLNCFVGLLVDFAPNYYYFPIYPDNNKTHSRDQQVAQQVLPRLFEIATLMLLHSLQHLITSEIRFSFSYMFAQICYLHHPKVYLEPLMSLHVNLEFYFLEHTYFNIHQSHLFLLF